MICPQNGVFPAAIWACIAVCDELLTYPLASTGEIARSGKLGLQDVVRSPIQAHLQLVFGTQTNWNGKPQGREVPMVLIPKMAVKSSARWSRDGMHGASAQCKQARLRTARRGVTGQAMNRAGQKCSGNGESPQSAVFVTGNTARSRPGNCAWQRTAEPPGKCRPQQGRSESRMPARAPVTKS